MSRGRHVITAHDIETAAYTGTMELTYDPAVSIVTPLARARANDLGVALRDASSTEPQLRYVDAALQESEIVKQLRPELVSEVIRRVQRRLDQR